MSVKDLSMHNQSIIPALIIVWVACVVLSLAVKLITGIQLPLFWIVIGLISVGSMGVWMWRAVSSELTGQNREKPRTAKEQNLFVPLQEIASNHNGKYEAVGRIGKLTLLDPPNQHVLTARTGTFGHQLLIASPIREGFRLELAPDPLPHKDLDDVQADSLSIDKTFFIKSNDVDLARQVIEGHASQLAAFGKDLSISTVRGKLEMKRKLPEFNYDNVMETYHLNRSIAHSIATNELASATTRVGDDGTGN